MVGLGLLAMQRSIGGSKQEPLRITYNICSKTKLQRNWQEYILLACRWAFAKPQTIWRTQGMVEALRRFGGLRFLADTFGEFVERFRIELRSEDGLSFR